MTTAELFRVSASALTRNKLRSFLTLLGVIIGVMTVVAVVSVISGLNSYVKDKVIGLNPDVVIFDKYGIITQPRGVAHGHEAPQPDDDRHGARAARMPALRPGRSPRRNGRDPSSSATAKLPAVEIQGHTPNMGEAMNFDLASGPLLHRDRVRPRRGASS